MINVQYFENISILRNFEFNNFVVFVSIFAHFLKLTFANIDAIVDVIIIEVYIESILNFCAYNVNERERHD